MSSFSAPLNFLLLRVPQIMRVTFLLLPMCVTSHTRTQETVTSPFSPNLIHTKNEGRCVALVAYLTPIHIKNEGHLGMDGTRGDGFAGQRGRPILWAGAGLRLGMPMADCGILLRRIHPSRDE